MFQQPFKTLCLKHLQYHCSNYSQYPTDSIKAKKKICSREIYKQYSTITSVGYSKAIRIMNVQYDKVICKFIKQTQLIILNNSGVEIFRCPMGAVSPEDNLKYNLPFHRFRTE